MNQSKNSFVKTAFVLCVSLVLPFALFAQGDDQWLSAGKDRNNTRHASTESKISVTTASDLAVKWAFATGGDISATPAVDEDHVYVPDWAGNLYKIDAATGELIWSVQIKDFTGQNFNISRTTPLLTGKLVVVGTQLGDPVGIGATLIALNQADGSVEWISQIDDHFASIVTQSPVAFGDMILAGVSSLEEAFAADQGYTCCSFRGSVVALDKNSGDIIWKTYTAPEASLGFSGNAVWGSTPVVDPKRGSVYVTTGNNYKVPDQVLACVEAGGSAEEVKACIDAIPGSSENYFDAFVALDLKTGAVKWTQSVIPFDAWTVACFFFDDGNCPDPAGPDYDFGQGPSLFKTTVNGKKVELLGAGQKSGIYWALDPDTGEIVWSTQVGPGGLTGGLQWGSATDGERIYTAVSNSGYQPHTMLTGPNAGTIVKGGFWAALDAASGDVLWENAGTNGPAIPDPFAPADAVAMNQGPVTVANGVVFAGALDEVGTMYAFDAATGNILWSFESGGSVNSGAAVVDGTVYWGSGYTNFGLGTAGNTLYAFSPALLEKSHTDEAGYTISTPDGYELAQNYPNPFNPVTEIQFSIPESGTVTVSVYNSSGQLVKTLASGVLEAGAHAYRWDATDFMGDKVPSGIYLYRLSVNNFVETRKMILMK